MKHIKLFEAYVNECYIAENFALYPSYGNMIGSEVLRNVPITHQVNQSVYGRDYVIDQTAPVAIAIEVKEGDAGSQSYVCDKCGCAYSSQEVEQNPAKTCTECGGEQFSVAK